MRQVLFLVTLTVSCLSAQRTFEAPHFSPGLRSHLELTPGQTKAILEINRRFSTYESLSHARGNWLLGEVTRGLALRTLAEDEVDALDQEFKSVRRDVETRRTRMREAIQALLTPAQKAKLTQLRIAGLSGPIVCDAAEQNLLVLPLVAGRKRNSAIRPFGACRIFGAAL